MANLEKSKVYLIGAGPGRADLITVRGMELIRSADCILYDRLINPELLTFARSGAELIPTPKRAGPDSVTQQKINEILLQKAGEGKTAIRLKGGGPGIFARSLEEATVLAGAGIEFEIVPGVTAAAAAADYAGIFLTERAYSSQVAFITGREAEGKIETGVDFALLAKFEGTLVFYMAVGNLAFICEQLINNGLAPDTPAAAIQNATLPTQRKVTTTVAGLAGECGRLNIQPPAIIVIGTAADVDDRLCWFSKLALFGKTIVTTRHREGNFEFASKIIAHGGNPLRLDTITIKPLAYKNEFLKAVTKINEYHWLVFTSANGVEILFEFLKKLDKDARIFSAVKIACIGPKTKDKLAEFAINADFVPTVSTSEQLGKQLIAAANLKNKKVLLLRSAQADSRLKQILTTAGAEVDRANIYSVEKQKFDCSEINRMLSDGQIDWLTFTSPSAAGSFFEQVDPQIVKKAKVKIASIGPVTSEKLRLLGLPVGLEAAEHTIEGLVAGITGADK